VNENEVASLLARHDALLERVTVLERALEGLADPHAWPPSLRDKPFIVAIRRGAQEVLDG
jgi:hypothetical protein